MERQVGNHELSPQPVPSRSTAVRIGGVLFSAVAFNWLSALWAPTAPIVIIAAILSLVLLHASDSSEVMQTPSLAWINSLRKDGFLELCLAALVLGSVVGAISVIPIWPTKAVHFPDVIRLSEDLHFKGVYNYEIGANASVVVMVAVAAYRAPSFRRQTGFLVFASYGLSMAYSYLRPSENQFFLTFIGSFLGSALVIVLLVAFPRMFTVMRSFWGFTKVAKLPEYDSGPVLQRNLIARDDVEKSGNS